MCQCCGVADYFHAASHPRILQQALIYSQPEVFNSDQAAQSIGEAFTGELKPTGVTITMDGRGYALDGIFVERLWPIVRYGVRT